MTRGEKLVLIALRKEHVRLQAVADKAQAESNEYMHVHEEMIGIYREFDEIVRAEIGAQAKLDKMEMLKKRQEKVDKIRKKDVVKVIDKAHDAKMDADDLLEQIGRLEYRWGDKT